MPSRENPLVFGDALDATKLWLVVLGLLLPTWPWPPNKLLSESKRWRTNKLNEFTFHTSLIFKINKLSKGRHHTHCSRVNSTLTECYSEISLFSPVFSPTVLDDPMFSFVVFSPTNNFHCMSS